MQNAVNLPQEIQSAIIQYIPHDQWYKVQGICELECGLSDCKIWKDLSLDAFSVFKKEQELLVTKFASFVKSLLWHTCKVHKSVDIHKLFESLCNLLTLDISFNTVFTDFSAIHNLRNLTELNIRGCAVGRLHLLGIFQSVNSLKLLDISECTKLKDKDIVRIAKKNILLEQFNVRESVSLSAVTVSQVEIILKNLKEFLFCAVVHRNHSRIWVPIYLKYPKLQICPAAAEIILELNPDILQ